MTTPTPSQPESPAEAETCQAPKLGLVHGSAPSSCHCPRCGKLKLTPSGKPHKCAVVNWRGELESALNELMRVAQNARRDGADCAADYIEYADRGLRNFTAPNVPDEPRDQK